MTVDAIYQYLYYITRKDPIGGTISDPQFNSIFLVAVFKYFKKLFGLPEEYEKGSERARQGFGLNALSELKIRPLKIKDTLLVNVATGEVDLPSDFFRYSSFFNDPEGDETQYFNVSVLNDQEFDEVIGAPIGPPSDTNIICNFQSTFVQFRPKDIGEIGIRYIKYPTTPIRGYVIDNDTAESIYVNNGAYVQVVLPGAAGDTITAVCDAITVGTYTVLSTDTAENVMEGLRDAINVNTLSHYIKAVYDGEKLVLVDSHAAPKVTLTVNVTGGVTIIKTNFSLWSVQCDWQDDIESMNDIAEIMLDMIGISNQNVTLVQWAEKEKLS